MAAPVLEKQQLTTMVDMALGTPDTTAVNFGVLRSLLHAMLTKLNIGSIVAEMESTGAVTIGQQQPEEVIKVPPPSTTHVVLDRLNILEQQMSALNSLPSSKELIDQVFSNKKTKERPVADMWQLTNLKKRADASEDGISKLSSLLDDLMRELAKVKEQNETMKKEIVDLQDRCIALLKIPVMESSIEALKKQQSQMQSYMEDLPKPDDFVKFITWDGLQMALSGNPDGLGKVLEQQQPSTRTKPGQEPQIDSDVANEVKYKSKMHLSSSFSDNGPDEKIQTQLENLGMINKMHALLEARVKALEELIKTKASYEDLEKVKVPDELLQQIAQMKDDIDALIAGRSEPLKAFDLDFLQDNEAMQKIRDAFQRLQGDVERLGNSMEELGNNNDDMITKIKELFDITGDHEGRKADINYVDIKIEPKADKHLVDSKVDFDIYEEANKILAVQLDDVTKKLMFTEDELRKLLGELSIDVDGKLNRSEMDKLKEWLEKKLRSLTKIKPMGGGLNDDDAAGLRKQLLQHFHCISCDKPLDVLPQGAVAPLPEQKGLPPTKTLRPYTTYELDAIRQHARNVAGDIVDLYQMPRACGGSHTVMMPHKRVVRMQNTNAAIEEEITDQPSPKKKNQPVDEVDLQGVDGHIYKGRDSRTYGPAQHITTAVEVMDKLPPVPSQTGMVSQQMDRPVRTPRTPSRQDHRPLTAERTGDSRLGPAPTPDAIAVPRQDAMDDTESAVATEETTN